MDILGFLLANWDSVLVVLAAAAGITVLIVKKQWGILDKIALALVTEAERQYGGGTGAIKLAAAVDWIYPKIPAVIRLFVSEAQIVKLIEDALVAAKAMWDVNPSLKAYVGAGTSE